MSEYILTNVRFSKEEHERLKRMAYDEGRSIASIVREAVSEYVSNVGGKTLSDDELKNDPFFKVLGIGDSGDPDDAAKHDQIYCKE